MSTGVMKQTRKYTGPMKGSQEAKDRMAKVREAQYKKNGLVKSNDTEEHGGAAPGPQRLETHRVPTG